MGNNKEKAITKMSMRQCIPLSIPGAVVPGTLLFYKVTGKYE